MTLMDTILRRKPVEMNPTVACNGDGWVYFNPACGEEYSRNHPINSGEVPAATHIRPATEMEDALDKSVHNWFRRAEQGERLAKHGTSAIKALGAEIEALKPDALKYREKLRRDREAAAAKRKAKGGVSLPDGLREQNGVIGFDCRVCDAFTGWDGEIADFEHGAHENVCGGSPRCCP